jgi:hypothetical protein
MRLHRLHTGCRSRLLSSLVPKGLRSPILNRDPLLFRILVQRLSLPRVILVVVMELYSPEPEKMGYI